MSTVIPTVLPVGFGLDVTVVIAGKSLANSVTELARVGVPANPLILRTYFRLDRCIDPHRRVELVAVTAGLKVAVAPEGGAGIERLALSENPLSTSRANDNLAPGTNDFAPKRIVQIKVGHPTAGTGPDAFVYIYPSSAFLIRSRAATDRAAISKGTAASVSSLSTASSSRLERTPSAACLFCWSTTRLAYKLCKCDGVRRPHWTRTAPYIPSVSCAEQ